MIFPYVGGLRPRRDALATERFAENLARFARGAPLLHAVDRARGYQAP